MSLKETRREGQERGDQESTWPKWQGSMGMGNWGVEAYELEKFGVGSRLRRVTGTDLEDSMPFGMLIGTSYRHLSLWTEMGNGSFGRGDSLQDLGEWSFLWIRQRLVSLLVLLSLSGSRGSSSAPRMVALRFQSKSQA